MSVKDKVPLKGCVREVQLSELYVAVHSGLFAGPARSSYVTAYGINDSQGELSGLLVRSVSDLDKAGDALKRKSNIHVTDL